MARIALFAVAALAVFALASASCKDELYRPHQKILLLNRVGYCLQGVTLRSPGHVLPRVACREHIRQFLSPDCAQDRPAVAKEALTGIVVQCLNEHQVSAAQVEAAKSCLVRDLAKPLM